MKRIFVVCVLVLFSCAFNIDAVAQSCKKTVDCAIYSLWYASCTPPLPPTVTNCWNGGPWQEVCEVPSDECAPIDASETCPTCGPPIVGQPISVATGNTFIEQTDLRVPGLSNGLVLVRTWNSMWPLSQRGSKVGLFGPNWRSTYEERVFAGSDGYMKYSRSDGGFWSFGFHGYGANMAFVYGVVAPANGGATLTSGTTYWTLTFKNGERRLFDKTSGSLSAIIDRNGNTTQISYDGLNRPVQVTDPANRHLYFAYSGSSYLVTGVTTDVGLSLSYSYDEQGRLAQVTKADLSTLSFEYETLPSQNDVTFLISAVKDSQGKILESHSYDLWGRGVSSSRANGVGAVTVTYQHIPKSTQ